MNTFDEFDEQTDFSFLALEESAPAPAPARTPVAVPVKKSRSVQVGNVCIDVRLQTQHSEEAKAKISAGNSGRKVSEETKAKLRTLKLEQAKPTSKRVALPGSGRQYKTSVMTPAGLFATKAEAAKHYQLHPRTILIRTRKFPTEFYYVETEISDENKAKMSARAKGHTMSAENKAKMSERRKGVSLTKASIEKMKATKSAKAQPFMTPLGPVLSKLEASKIFGVDKTTIRNWELKYPEYFYYITKDLL